MKKVFDDLRPEPGPKMWQKFDIEGIVNKEFVPPGQSVNGKFYCEVLSRLRENIRSKRRDKRWNNFWPQHHYNAPAHASLVVQQFLASMNTTVIPTLSTHRTSPPVIFSYSRRWNWNSRGDVLTALKNSRPNRWTRWRRWREMTSRSAFYHGNPTGIAVSIPKRTTPKRKGASRNFGKRLRYGRGISANLGCTTCQGSLGGGVN